MQYAVACFKTSEPPLPSEPSHTSLPRSILRFLTRSWRLANGKERNAARGNGILILSHHPGPQVILETCSPGIQPSCLYAGCGTDPGRPPTALGVLMAPNLLIPTHMWLKLAMVSDELRDQCHTRAVEVTYPRICPLRVCFALGDVCVDTETTCHFEDDIRHENSSASRASIRRPAMDRRRADRRRRPKNVLPSMRVCMSQSSRPVHAGLLQPRWRGRRALSRQHGHDIARVPIR